MPRLLFLYAALVASAPAPPTDLRAETLSAPLLVDNLAPRFSWALDPSVAQAAFRVQVWAGPAFTNGRSCTGASVWDSGAVASNASAQIEYKGAALAADSDYCFMVSIQENSATLSFEQELLRSAEALRESEKRFRLMADSSPAMIWTSTADGSGDYYNRTWLDFTGRALEEEINDGWIEGIHPEDRDRAIAGYLQSLAGGVPHATP